MSEFVLSGLGVLLLYVAVMPLVTLLGKLCLVLYRRRLVEPSDFGSAQAYLLLVSLVLGPAIWFVSAVGHMSESSPTSIVCRLGHVDQDLGRIALALILVVSTFVGCLVLRRMGRAGTDGLLGLLPPEHSSVSRVVSLCSMSDSLRPLLGRIDVVASARIPICTTGYLKPRVKISGDWMGGLEDAALMGALLHEAEHMRGRDPLRFLVAALCMSLNPLAFLLRPEFARWRQARELFCDRVAVELGANPMALAEALLAAARPGRHTGGTFVAQLGAGAMSWLQFRIQLLMGYASAPPKGRASRLAPAATLLASGFLLVVPHVMDAWPLVSLHHALEAAFADWRAPSIEQGNSNMRLISHTRM